MARAARAFANSLQRNDAGNFASVAGGARSEKNRIREADAGDNAGQRLLCLGTNAMSEGSRAQAQAGGHTRHYYRPHFVATTFLQPLVEAIFGLGAADAREKNDRTQGGNPSQRSEPNGG